MMGFLDKIGFLKRLLSFFCVYGYSRVFRLDELILDNVFSLEFLRKSLRLPETEILLGGLFNHSFNISKN